MARTWEYTWLRDETGEATEYLSVEYRPGGSINILMCAGGDVVELVGMPWLEFLAMMHTMHQFQAADMEILAREVEHHV